MSIETATYIADLQPTNPPSSDPRGQGDDHLRLIKQVLQNTFQNASRAFAIPGAISKSANYTILSTDEEKTFYTTTTGGSVTYTLPNGLASTDAGWRVKFLKITTDANPIFIAPASGTLTSGAISGLSAARRCIPGVLFEAVWSGTAWFVSRCLGLPIGSMIDYDSATLPPGYEWPNGQTLSSSANYPEYNSAKGGLTTLDLRGRATRALDNLGGSAAGRLSGGVITGTAVGNSGGADTITLDRTMIPTGITSSGSALSVSVTSTSAVLLKNGSATTQVGSGTPVGITYISPADSTLSSSGSTSAPSVTSNNTGGLAHSNLGPTIMCAKILVVE